MTSGISPGLISLDRINTEAMTISGARIKLPKEERLILTARFIKKQVSRVFQWKLNYSKNLSLTFLK